MARSVSFNVAYDAKTDVLYLTARREAAARATEDAYGVVWRYDGAGQLIGATVMDFREVWSDKPSSLAQALATGFDIPEPQALTVVEHALEDGR